MTYLMRIMRLGIMLTVALGIASCNRDKKFALHNYQANNLQLTSFAITSESTPSLSTYFFSINNAEGQGKIVNARPLPYGTKLENVQIALKYSGSNIVVSIAIGSGTYTEWKNTNKYSIPSGVRDIYIKMAVQDTSLEYTYHVKINEYQYDPQTIEWHASRPISGQLLRRGGMVFPHNGRNILADYRDAASGGTKFYAIGLNAPIVHPATPSIQEVMLGGLPSAAVLTNIVYHGEYIYALSDQGVVYELDNNAWRALPVGKTVRALYGVFAPRDKGGAPTLALVTYTTEDATLRYASYAAGKLSENDRPVTFVPDWTHPIAISGRYMSNSLTLAAATRGEGGSAPQRKALYSSNGTSWMELAAEQDAQAYSSIALAQLSDMLYRFETTPSGLSIYTSADEAKTWTKSGDVAYDGITSASLATRHIAAWSTSGSNTIYLLSGVGSSGVGSPVIWSGIPKRNEY